MAADTAEKSKNPFDSFDPTGKRPWDPRHPQWPKTTRGFSGECIHITILPKDGEENLVECQLGDLPKINIVRGVDWIIPIEYKNHFVDSAVPSFEHVFLPGAQTPIVRKIKMNRYPAQFGASATWEEYEDFCKKVATEGVEVS